MTNKLKGATASRVLRGLALLGLLEFGAGTAAAEVPVKFTYQGNLRQNGFLVNGSRSMVFRIYDSSTSTTALWTSGVYNVQLSTGVFRVTLEPALSDWQAGNLWLELEVAGVRMSPREEVTSSPYSVNSLMVSGKRYTTASSAPSSPTPVSGDLWMDTVTNTLKFWNGSVWMLTSGSGVPGVHAHTHAAGGSDPIVDLGTHTVHGYITVSSAVNAGWFSGDGANLGNLNASQLLSGTVSDARLSANVDLLDANQTVVGAKTFISSVTVVSPLGVISERVKFNDDNITAQRATAAQYGGVAVSTHIYTPGNVYAARIIGDISGAWGLTGADDLGNHIATMTLDMSGFGITAAKYVVASSFTATGPGGFYGLGSSITGLDASAVTLGTLSGNRIGNVIVSTHIVDGAIQNQDLADASITRSKLNQSGCSAGQFLQWDGAQWSCVTGGSLGVESDPLAIHNSELPEGTTFYVSSGTANNLNVNYSLTVQGTSHLKGAPGQEGLRVESTGNVGIGLSGAAARLQVKGSDTQNYSLAVGTGTVNQVVVSTSGAVGIGTQAPRARLDVSGEDLPGGYIAIFNSGPKVAAWLRNK
ncbi:MAG: hypothetical protein HY952_01220 [Elusimicrobia bacterium]|nr:hypothetical protein [Elusimicrobiota bacterium]